MTLQQIIDLVRRRQGNYEPPYHHIDTELVDYANDIVNTIARESLIIEDSTTPAACYLTLVDSTIDYTYDTRIIEISDALITGYLSAITQTGSGLDDIAVCGDYTLDDTNTSYVVYCDSAGATDTFKWSDDGGTTWEETLVDMTGEYQELNNGIYVKFSATTGHSADDYWSFTVYYTSGGMLTRYDQREMYDEYPRWRAADTDEPDRFITDYTHNKVSFYPPPDQPYLVAMRIIRYPSSQLSATSMSSQTPELPTTFHPMIVEGILGRAYMRQGANTYDEKKAAMHQALFNQFLDRLKRNNVILQNHNKNLSPHYGTI